MTDTGGRQQAAAASRPGARAAVPLAALAIGAFGIGVTEFSPMGLLPEIAGSLKVGVPAAGGLVSAYALGVMAGAPVMTLLLARLRQKQALLLLMLIFVVGNAAAAAAPSFGALVGARLLTSLGHAASFGIGSVLAASLVPPGRGASAIAAMLFGLTIANVGGVPAATWIGQTVGWRTTFAGVAGLGILAMLALQAALPRGERCGAPDFRRELLVLVRPATLVALLTTVAGAGAMFATYTYIAPLLRALAHADSAHVTLALVAVGIGFTLGNGIAGRLADRAAEVTVAAFLVALALMSLLLPLMLRQPLTAAVGLVAWGAAAFGVVPPVQTLVMRRAKDAPGLASSVNIGAFNVGNALGAVVGAVVLSATSSYGALPAAGAVLAAAGVLLVWVGSRGGRRAEGA